MTRHCKERKPDVKTLVAVWGMSDRTNKSIADEYDDPRSLGKGGHASHPA